MQFNSFFNTSLNKTAAKEMQQFKKIQLFNKVFTNKFFKKDLLKKALKGLEGKEIMKYLLEHIKTVLTKFLYQNQRVMKKTLEK